MRSSVCGSVARSALAGAMWVCLIAVIGQAAAGEPVRELSRAGHDVTVGTSRFRLSVNAGGTVHAVHCGGTRLISFISLYTDPVSPDTGKSLRCCQTESPGLGDRPSDLQAQYGSDCATLTITRDCSHPQVHANEPLWRLVETVTVWPDGRLRLQYRCRWHRLVRMAGFSLVTALTTDAVRGKAFTTYLPGMQVPGEVPGDLPPRDLGVGLMGAEFATAAGPLTLWFGGTSRVQVQDWGQYTSLMASPVALPHSNMIMYRDTASAFSVSLRLPVN